MSDETRVHHVPLALQHVYGNNDGCRKKMGESLSCQVEPRSVNQERHVRRAKKLQRPSQPLGRERPESLGDDAGAETHYSW